MCSRLQCQLVKFCIGAEFLETKLSEKSNCDTREGVPTLKQERQARYVIIAPEGISHRRRNPEEAL